MRKILIIIAVCFSQLLFAQGEKRVNLKTCFKATGTGEGDLILTAIIEKGFHIFAFEPGGDGGQIPTTVKFDLPAGVSAVGKIKEDGTLIKEDVKELEIIINYFKNEVKYIQHVKYEQLAKGKGVMHYQVCNDGMCERECDKPFIFDMTQNCDGSINKTNSLKNNAAVKSDLNAKDSLGKIAKKDSLKETLKKDTSKIATAALVKTPNLDSPSVTATDLNNTTLAYGKYGIPIGDCGEIQQKELSPWLAFLYGILGGLAGLFFPCTLPMIPMTISFFMKGNSTRREGIKKGIWYGFSIFLVYFLFSLPFLLFNASSASLNGLATNVTVNLVYFAVFMAFAFSLFGYYDLSLPAGLASKIDSKSNNKNLLGIFFMALTLAIVSFSCTGPILGLVLGNIKQANLITPAMSGFGIGLGLPFALFAMFPNLLKAMPKSGSWLTTLKVVFGFIEVAFALKFLSNADLVKQWGLLKRETFIVLWVVILILMALYLLGKFTPKKGYENAPVGKPSKVLAILTLLFAGYISLDLVGKEPKLISGFPPPPFYSYFHKEDKLTNGTAATTHDFKGMKIYLNLEDAMAEGKKQGKPVMIDFTGWACVNCRRMEENVWTNSDVYKNLKDNYVIASLYVDDRREMQSDEKFFSPFLKAEAKTIGDKWFDLSLRHFRNAGQPFYALIDPVSEKILNTPKAYTPEVDVYNKFLECGLANYKSLHP
jgi:thiol:disulfide interchange protein